MSPVRKSKLPEMNIHGKTEPYFPSMYINEAAHLYKTKVTTDVSGI